MTGYYIGVHTCLAPSRARDRSPGGPEFCKCGLKKTTPGIYIPQFNRKSEE